MTIKDFIAKYDGKFVEYHSYGSGSSFQCVDICNQWITEGLGLTAIIGTNAQDFPKKIGNQFKYILNTPTGQPEPGDLMIFKSADGVGHISIHTKNISLSLFTSFDQNYPTGSSCKLVNHNYTNVLGWMRAKGVTTSDTQCQVDLAEANKHKENLQKQVDGLLVDIKAWETKYNECNTQRIEAGSSSDGFRSQLNTLVAQLATKLGTRQEVPEILASVDTLLTYEVKADELERKLAKEESDHAQAISSMESKIASLESQLQILKSDLQAVKSNKSVTVQSNNIWSIIKLILGVK